MSKKQNVSEYFDNIMGGSNPSKVSNEPEEAASQQPEKRGKGRPREDGYESRTFRVKTETKPGTRSGRCCAQSAGK